MKQYAITGRHCLYFGTAATRRQAIARHVWAIDRECFDAGYPIPSRALNEMQKRAWEECRKRGDRAIKVEVTPIIE